jgi:hypothetical protein
MISARHLRDYLNEMLRLAWTSGISFKLHYKDRVFLLTIEPTGETYKRRPPKRKKKGKVYVYLNECEECRGILVSGMCIEKSCPSNNQESHNIT